VESATHIPYRAIVIFSALTSAPEVAEHLKGKFLPALALIPVRPLMQERFDSASRIAQVHSPLLIMHGEADEMMPLSMPKTLYSRTKVSCKKLLVIPGGGHNTVFYLGEEAFFIELKKLLQGSERESSLRCAPPYSVQR
jgi:alpha-beta hydrolase superfamily lysophospholipase